MVGGPNPQMQQLQERLDRLEEERKKELKEKRGLSDEEIKRLESGTAMQIYVKNYSGNDMTIVAEPSYEISKVKTLIEEKEGTPPEYQRLLFGGKELVNDKTLEYYNIQNENTIQVVVTSKE